MRQLKFLDLQYYNSTLANPMQEAIAELLDSGNFIKGEAVHEFAKQFINFQDVKYGVPCGNGTDALEIIFKSLYLKENSTVIVPNNTFIATAEAVVNAGHNVQICDFDDSTQNMCPIRLKHLCDTKKIDAVIFVHLYGNTSGIREVSKICKQNNIPLIEDCAQAHGAKNTNITVGNFGVAAAFSFYPGKVLGGIGDSGMIVTNSSKLYENALRICDHGRLKKFDHEKIGRNSRMDTIQAKYLLMRLKFLAEDLDKREKCRIFYFNNINKEKYTIYAKENSVFHGNHLFPIRSKNKSRGEISVKLLEVGIPTGCHYPSLLSDTGLFNTNKITPPEKSRQSNLFSLPIGPHLSEADLGYIVKKLNDL